MDRPEEKPDEESKLGGFKESSLALPPDSEKDWPLNFKELLAWQHDKVLPASKEAELRIKHATQIVADCADGKTTLQEAGERTHEYTQRWGESLRGVVAAHLKTDDQIIEEMDAHRSGKWLDYVKENRKVNVKARNGHQAEGLPFSLVRMSRLMTRFVSRIRQSDGSTKPNPSRADLTYW